MCFPDYRRLFTSEPVGWAHPGSGDHANPGHTFEDDPAGNIACVGAYKSTVAGISELIDLSLGLRV